MHLRGTRRRHQPPVLRLAGHDAVAAAPARARGGRRRDGGPGLGFLLATADPGAGPGGAVPGAACARKRLIAAACVTRSSLSSWLGRPSPACRALAIGDGHCRSGLLSRAVGRAAAGRRGLQGGCRGAGWGVAAARSVRCRRRLLHGGHSGRGACLVRGCAAASAALRARPRAEPQGLNCTGLRSGLAASLCRCGCVRSSAAL